MIEVTSILVKSYDLDHYDIFWKLNDDSTERIEEYDFFILRSVDGAAGPYRQIAGPFYNTFRFRDPDVHSLHKWRKYYYKIKVTHRRTQDSREFGPDWMRAKPDRIALEIQRRESLLFKEKAGRMVAHFPRLTFGQRCGNCWDKGPRGNTIGRPKQQNCSTCFDTTFVGGYAAPMAIWMQIDPSAAKSQATDIKEHQFVQTTARTTAFPPIHQKDLLVESENKRWRVESVSYTEKHRAIIRQELKLREFGKDDVTYSVPISFDLLLEHTPERAFTRPMDLQDRQPKAVPNVLEEGWWPR